MEEAVHLPVNTPGEVIAGKVASGEEVILDSGGKPVAAVVSIARIQYLEALEDKLDAAAADAGWKSFLDDGSQGFTVEQVEELLGLD